MKNVLFIVIISILLTSCVSTKTVIPDVSGVENLKREDYTLLDEKTEEAFNMRFWIVFLPFGGKNNKARESKCYNRMIKNNHADGILTAKYKHSKVSICLLAISFQSFNTTLTGKPYILKTDKLEAIPASNK